MVKSTKSKKFSKKHLIILLVALLAAAIVTTTIIILANAPHCRGLVGTWKLQNDQIPGNYSLTFRSGDTGLDNQNGETFDFTYTDHEGVFELFYPDDEISSFYSYRISKDNNTLTIQDSEGADVIYVCE